MILMLQISGVIANENACYKGNDLELHIIILNSLVTLNVVIFAVSVKLWLLSKLNSGKHL